MVKLKRKHKKSTVKEAYKQTFRGVIMLDSGTFEIGSPEHVEYSKELWRERLNG